MKEEFTNIEQSEIVEKYIKGIKPCDIAIEYNTDEHHIRVILKEKQIDRKYNAFQSELSNRIIELHKAGFLHKDIRYILLVSDIGINKTLDRNNVPRMSYEERNQRYNRNSHYFDIIDNSDKAYILGWLFSDGNNFPDHNAISLSVQSEDVEILEYIKDQIQYEGDIRVKKVSIGDKKYKDQALLCINDSYMSKQLYNLGLINNKSLTLTFPTSIPEQYMSHFLRGYFEGDGCIYNDDKNNKTQTSIVGTYEFVIKIQEYMTKIGCKSCVIKQNKKGKYKDSDTWIVRICGNKSSYKFLSWIYKDATMVLKRKYDKFLYMKDNYCNGKSYVE